jgi:hypothetical protein
VSNLNSVVLPGYDGLFADDVWTSLRTYSYNTNASNFNSSDISRWHTDVLDMLQYVKANISEKLLVINTDQLDGYDYVDAADGMMIEPYAHAPWEPSTYYSIFQLSKQISYLSAVSGMGKIIFAVSGVSDTVTSQTVKYCYASYMLGVNGSKAYWGFNDWNSGDGSKGYYSIMDTNIGAPSGAYYSNQNVYMRDFTNGKVLFNPSDNPETIDLDGSFWLLNNTEVSNVTLDGYSGEILLNAPFPSPTASPSPDPSDSEPSLSPALTPFQFPSPSPSRSPSLSPALTPFQFPSPSSTLTPASSQILGSQLASIGLLGVVVLLFVVAFRRSKLLDTD